MQRSKKVINEFDISEFIKNTDLHGKTTKFVTKGELRAEKDKIVKLQTSLFIGQSYFTNDESQNFLIFQPIFSNFFPNASSSCRKII